MSPALGSFRWVQVPGAPPPCTGLPCGTPLLGGGCRQPFISWDLAELWVLALTFAV